jgi:hypothetical protein
LILEEGNMAKKQLYTKGIKNISDHVLPKVCHLNRGVPQRTIAADVNLRAGHNRYTQDAQRPSDKIPTEHSDIILACQAVYRKIGMVRNIIDLMTDYRYGSQYYRFND